MDDFISQYQWTAIEMVSGLLSISFLFTVCSQIRIIEPVTFMSINQSVEGVQVEYDIPLIEEGDFIVDNAIIKKGEIFNWKDYVRVMDNNNISLIDYVSVNGIVDTQTVGEYTLTFILNYNGKTIIRDAILYVREINYEVSI